MRGWYFGAGGVLLLLAGCRFDPQEPAEFRCSATQQSCPAGLTCHVASGLCLAPDGGAGAEQGAPDGPVADGPVADGTTMDTREDALQQSCGTVWSCYAKTPVTVQGNTGVAKPRPRVAGRTGGFLVTWTHKTGAAPTDVDVKARSVQPSSGLDPVVDPITTGDSQESAVACDGTDCLVLAASASGSSSEIRGRLVAAGKLAGQEQVLDSNIIATLNRPAVTAKPGGGYRVVWVQSASAHELRRCQTDAQGKLQGTPQQLAVLSSDSSTPALAATSGQVLAVWDDNSQIVKLAPVPPTDSPVVLANTDKPGWPDLACSQSGCLAVWTVTDPAQVMARRVSAGWPPLLDTEFTVQQTTSSAPVVATGGGMWLVVWATGPEVKAAGYDAGGTQLGTTVLSTSTSGLFSAPDVAWSGNQFLVVWTHSNGGTINIDGVLFGP